LVSHFALMSDPYAPESGRTPAAETDASLELVPEPPREPRGERRGVSRALLAATLLVAILASGAVWLDSRRADRALRTEVAQRLTQLERTAGQSTQSQAQLAAEVRDAHAKITLLETRLAESQEQQAGLEALYRDLSPSRDELALTEIEQLVTLAGQHLELAGNVSGARAALQVADAKLQRQDQPQWLPLRRALARDIDRLKGVPFVDVPGLTVRLDQAIAAIDTLPLAMDERVPPTTAPPPAQPETRWERFLRDVATELRQLVRIEVSDRPAAPLLPASQQYFVRENLKLRLLAARIALLARDDVSFKADLLAAQTWLSQYFDTRAKPVQAVQAIIRQVAATPMPTQIPDIARTLDAVRVLRLSAERGATREATSAPARNAR
jgi:uroporphyrin-III C-methyltransferase